MRNKVGIGFWRRPEKAMRKFVKVHYCSIPVLVILSVAIIPQFAHAFGSSNRRPLPPPQQTDRQLAPGPGPNNRPPGPPLTHHQSIRRQGLPFEGGPREQTGNTNNNNNNAPIGHRRIQNHPHGPPPPHGKHRGRPPPSFPFPRRRPPPPPPRGRGPPPRGEREREQEPRDGPRRPPFKQQSPPTETPKLSFHIPPAPLTTAQPPQQQQHHQEGFQQRPPQNGPHSSESQLNLQQQFHPNQQNQPQFHQQLQQQQHQFQQQQQQNSQFPQLNNGNQFQNQPPQFPNQQQFPQNSAPQQPNGRFPQGPSAGPPNEFQQGGPSAGPPNGFQQQGPQNEFQQQGSPNRPPNGFQQQGPPHGPLNEFQQQGPPHGPPSEFQQQGPPHGPPSEFQQQGPPNGPSNGFQQQGPPTGPPNGFQQGPSAVPPTQFQPGPSGNPSSMEFQHQGPHLRDQGFHLNNPQQHLPQMNPSQVPPFNHQQQQLPPFQQQHQQQQPVFGQINPPPPSGPPHHHMQSQHNPNNPPILEYAPPPNTFQSTPQPDFNLLEDKSKEIELNSIPKQTITFTVTPKPSKAGGTQLHFKISTPKPFKSTLKPHTNSKGYFKGSTYRPPVDKLNSKFKYTNSNAGYPDAEYKPQDGNRRESSMSAEMAPPGEKPRNSIKDLLLNREHSLNTPSGPHPDDTDNYAGPSYEAPPIFVKPISGEQVLIAGMSGGKTSYYKNHHPDDLPFHGPSSGTPFEDYDNAAIGIPNHGRNPFMAEDEDIGSKSYAADRHLPSHKDPGYEEYSRGKLHEDTYTDRRPHSGSHEGPFDEFEHGRKNRPRPSSHSHEEAHSGSGESKRGNNRHGIKFSQPDPLYHPEEDGGSSVSKERERDNGEEVDDRDRYEGFGFGGSGERRHKDKDYRKDSSKNTAEELLAALGLSTNPLISMPDSKYPPDIPTKYTMPGSWEKDYSPDSEHKRNKNTEGGKGGGGEPLGLLEYLNQKKEEESGQPGQHATEPLYSVPDRQIGGSAENSFVVKGSMKAGGGSGSIEKAEPDIGKASSNNVIVGRPIPQFQGSESDIIITQHASPSHQPSSYVEQKLKGHSHSYGSSSSGQESYLYEKIHGNNPKTQVNLAEPHLPVINSGLYGPSVPPPLSEPGTFTNSPPVLSSAAPIDPLLSLAGPSASSLLLQQQASVLNSAPSSSGSESYLYEKIHGSKPAAGLAFGPTPPAAHSVEDLSHSGLYNTHHGLYASGSEQVVSASGPPSPTGLVYSHGKVINPQQPQQQVPQQSTIGNGVLLPLGFGGNQQPTGLTATNTIPVQAPQQKPSNPHYISHQQQQHTLQNSVPQQQILIAQPSAQQPTVLLPQQHQQQNLQVQQQQQQQQQHLVPQQQLPVVTQQQPIHSGQQPQHQQQPGSLYQSPPQVAPQPQQSLQGQQSQHVAHVLPLPTQQQQQPQQFGNLYGLTGNEQVDRSALVPHPHYSGEVGLSQQSQQSGLLPQASQPQYQQQQVSYLQQQIHGNQPQQSQSHQSGNPYGQSSATAPVYAQPQYNPYGQTHQDPSLASNFQHQHAIHQQSYAAASGVTPRYGEAYPIYVTEPDPIIEIIVQDSNMSLPAMPTLPPPPPPPPPTPEPVHVFYVKYSQKNNTPVFDNYYGQSNPQIQLEQPISSVPVRGPDRNGMLAVDDTQDSLSQSSVQHQSIYNNIYATSTESSVSTTPSPSSSTTLRTIIRPDRNELSHGSSSGLVVSFDNPAVEHEIFANYTNNFMQQQQQQLQQQYQQQQQQVQQHQQAQQQQAEQSAPQEQPQQQAHAYPDITFSQQAYQQYTQQQQQEVHQQQQQYPSLDSLWGGLTSEQKSVMEQQQQQQQQQQASQNAYQGFNKRIGLQELASLLETNPQGGDDQQKHPEHINQNINLQDYHSMHQDSYSMSSDDQNPAPLYQYVEQSPHQSTINTRQAKLPDDVPEELRNQLVQSGILGNADVQVINYSENLFKELGDLPPEAMAAFHAHTGNTGQNKQLDTEAGASPSSLDQSVWSGSQVSLANADLASLMPSGRSLRSILVVKNSLRPKRGGRQRRVVLLITNKDDVLLYRPKDRSLKRIGDTTSNPVIRGAVELSNHRMDDEESVAVEDHHDSGSA